MLSGFSGSSWIHKGRQNIRIYGSPRICQPYNGIDLNISKKLWENKSAIYITGILTLNTFTEVWQDHIFFAWKPVFLVKNPGSVVLNMDSASIWNRWIKVTDWINRTAQIYSTRQRYQDMWYQHAVCSQRWNPDPVGISEDFTPEFNETKFLVKFPRWFKIKLYECVLSLTAVQ